MITRPTTDALVLDCCRELSEEILPALEDQTLKLRLIMTITVLENAAVRAANEIAWMRAETDRLVAFAAELRDDPAVAAALAATDAGTRDSLLLNDVVETYERASRAFDAALLVAQREHRGDAIARAASLLRDRVDTEKSVMAGYAVVGR